MRLPGFNIPIIDHLDEENHQLRYVLKNRKTGDVYLVVLLTLLLLGTEDGEHYAESEGEHIENEDKQGNQDQQQEDEVD